MRMYVLNLHCLLFGQFSWVVYAILKRSLIYDDDGTKNVVNTQLRLTNLLRNAFRRYFAYSTLFHLLLFPKQSCFKVNQLS